MAAAAPPPAGPAWKVWVGGLVALVVLVGLVFWALQRLGSAQATVAQPTATLAPTAYPTYTPRPTYTPYPTATQVPKATATRTPEPTATATATAQATATPVPQETATPAAGISPQTAPPGPPQPQQRNPSFYERTGKGANTRTWDVPARPGHILIVGGFCVDGTCNGVYKAVSADKARTVSVTDGFVLTIEDFWARDEWCFRLGQAQQFGWAHEHVHPLSGWVACPADP